MNDTAIRHTRAGFKYDDTLATRLSFSGVIRLWEKDHVQKDTIQGPIEYWSLKDEYGARMTCFDESLAEKLIIGEWVEVYGEIKIGKGGTFLNLKKASPFRGSDFIESEENKEAKPCK